MMTNINEILEYCRKQKEQARQIKDSLPVEKIIQGAHWESKYETYADLIFRITGKEEN